MVKTEHRRSIGAIATFATFLLISAVVFLPGCGVLGLTGGKPAGKVSFVEPKDGASVVSPFTVKMDATGVKVEPASAGVNKNAGHHHIIIDAALPPPGSPVPSDAQHKHFGLGQTETVLDLPVGQHTLRLSFADGKHNPLDPAVTSTIKVTVVK